MRRAPLVTVTLLIGTLLTACTEPADGPGDPLTVTSIHDGDTLRGEMNGQDVRVRFLAIDAPEISQAPWGVKSRDHLRRMLDGRDVRLETDREPTDRYGRTLAWIWVREGNDWELVNERMVREGYATAYVLRDNTKYAERVRDAEDAARDAGVNIWDRQTGLRQRPSEYRQQNR